MATSLFSTKHILKEDEIRGSMNQKKQAFWSPSNGGASSVGMSSSSGAVTGSAALTELKKDLTQLSATLHEIFELMNMDMRNIGDAWQDGKYQEFVDGYRPQINKCEEISERYKEWCLRVLDPTIENVVAVEKTDVGGGGSGPVGGTGGGGNAAGTGASGATDSKIGSMERLGRGTNLGSRGPSASNAQPAGSATGRLATSTGNSATGTISARSAAKPTTSPSSNAARSATKSATNTSQISAKIGDGEGVVRRLGTGGKKTSTQTSQTKTTTTSAGKLEKKQSTVDTADKLYAEADEICKKNERSDKVRAKIATPKEVADGEVAVFSLSSKKSEDSGSYSARGEMSADVKTDFKIPVIKKGADVSVGAKVSGEYNSGKEASDIIGNYNFKCVEDTTNE